MEAIRPGTHGQPERLIRWGSGKVRRLRRSAVSDQRGRVGGSSGQGGLLVRMDLRRLTRWSSTGTCSHCEKRPGNERGFCWSAPRPYVPRASSSSGWLAASATGLPFPACEVGQGLRQARRQLRQPAPLRPGQRPGHPPVPIDRLASRVPARRPEQHWPPHLRAGRYDRRVPTRRWPGRPAFGPEGERNVRLTDEWTARRHISCCPRCAAGGSCWNTPSSPAAVLRRCSHDADTPPPASGAESSCTGPPVAEPKRRTQPWVDGQGLTGGHRRQG
jgi:hypothetical protein